MGERVDTEMLAAAVRNMSAVSGCDYGTARGIERWAVRHFWIACGLHVSDSPAMNSVRGAQRAHHR